MHYHRRRMKRRMQKRILALIACLALPGSAGAQEACPTREGDTVDAVRKQYGLSADPAKLPRATPGGAASQFSLVERGILIVFDSGGRVTTMRFSRPFAGKVGGVAIGDGKDTVRKLRGDPQTITAQGTPDMLEIEDRRKRKQALLDALPDPVAKAEVLRVFEDMRRIDAQPIRFLTGWLYKPGTADYARYDFGSPNDTVQVIVARSCKVE
jgi:hypothetical protein